MNQAEQIFVDYMSKSLLSWIGSVTRHFRVLHTDIISVRILVGVDKVCDAISTGASNDLEH